MAQGVRGVGGGILGLRQLLSDRETKEAIQADLLASGRTLADLGTWALSWWDLKCLLRHRPQGSALDRHLQPQTWQWTLLEHLLAGIYDTLQGANWQRGGDKNAPRPTPLPRPGVGDDDAKPADEKPSSSASIPLDDIHDVMAARRAQRGVRAVVADAPPDPASPPPAAPRRRLAHSEVRAIRTALAAGASHEDLATFHRVPAASIRRIADGATYRHVT